MSGGIPISPPLSPSSARSPDSPDSPKSPNSPDSPISDRSSAPSLRRGYSKDLQVFDVKRMVAQLQEKAKAEDKAEVLNKPDRPIIARIPKPTLESGLGLLLDTTPGAGILICGHIPRGPIGKYNKKADAEAQIKPGDHMIRVNSMRGDVTRMVEEIHSDTTVEVEVWRPLVWTAVITKRSVGESLGMKLRYETESRFPIVWELNQGAVERYNEEVPQRAIRTRDRIISVNGTSAEPSILTCLMFGGSNTITLCLIRCSFEEQELVSRETTEASTVQREATEALDSEAAGEEEEAEAAAAAKRLDMDLETRSLDTDPDGPRQSATC